ncbi:anhydro-N-acetylmuramic acid kinase [Rhizobium albus]|nr:anhydro-N-acetylmuramic acid kinase [Rhizobium albus]
MGRVEAESRLTAIGLMSGTSLDGIDIALVSTDGEAVVERGPAAGYSYEPAFRRRLADALETAKAITKREDRPGDLGALERDLTLRHAEAVRRFVTDNGLRLSDIDVIGFHGQTVLHRPGQALTVQLGLGQLLADELGVPVVYDMRANDMAHGGEGAPLVPVYHRALAAALEERPVVFVNIGGISNVTYVGESGELVAFDSGPGNTLIDQWVERHAGVPFDQGGAIASEGGVIAALAERYLASDFFTADIRRSLDRNDFPPPADHEAELADGARTLAHVSAAAIIRAADHFPTPPKRWIVCGGGRKNRVIVEDLRTMAAASGGKVAVAEDLGLDGDGMEAEAWAYLAVRSLKGLALTFPGTTRVDAPVTGGVTAYPHRAESP